ncbi:hypothetical protein [Actinotalea sp.]|uniref:restriction system modified-DNA reader domain-containing protein n=1 Tax=Actinotalea sp. TaxID=1872145 RepID=UPI003561ACEB
MPMFQVDDGKAVVVQPVRPASQAFGETSRALTEHLDTLLGEQLLPVRVRTPGQDEPYLLAVDCNGHPVVVEVTALLDPGAVVRALRYTGRVARMSLRDVGGLHPEGRERFARDLAVFRDSVPVSGLGASAAGARLLLVCSEVGEGMDEVVEALTQPGRGVDILQVGVLDSADGSQLLDVSPARRAPTVAAAPGPIAQEAAPAGRAGAPAAVPPAALISVVPGRSASSAGEPAPEGSMATRQVPVVAGDGVPHRISTGVRLGVPAPAAGNGRAGDDGQGVLAPGNGRRVAREETAAADDRPAADDRAAGAAEPTHLVVEAPPREPAYGPDSRLVALAVERGGSLVLVWWRRRRGVRYEAMLHADGSIELADGTRAMDPSAAAEIASGAHVPVDGWQVWRVEQDEGLTLAEAVASVPASAQPQP